MDIIDVTDLASYLDDETALNSDRVQLLVGLANDLVSDNYAGTDVDNIPARVRAITLEVAARAHRNPNGYSSETVDDYTYRRDSETRQAGIYLTDAELADLGGSTARVYQGWLA